MFWLVSKTRVDDRTPSGKVNSAAGFKLCIYSVLLAQKYI